MFCVRCAIWTVNWLLGITSVENLGVINIPLLISYRGTFGRYVYMWCCCSVRIEAIIEAVLFALSWIIVSLCCHYWFCVLLWCWLYSWVVGWVSCLMRNLLVVEGVDITDGYLWLDCDTVKISPDIIQSILFQCIIEVSYGHLLNILSPCVICCFLWIWLVLKKQ